LTKTILIVEDNELDAKLFTQLLEEAGYATVLVKDGGEVLEAVRRHRPDLIVMDIQLPNVSGLEATRMLKADDAYKAIPVIAVTAFAMKGDEERFLDGGCDFYISKPFEPADFLERIARFLG